MSDPQAKEIFELYDYMEDKLEKLGISFDEFTILYKSFRNPPTQTSDKPQATPPNPFPWAQAAGAGWS